MSFLKKLFKKKAGGSFFGNLIRGASSSVTGGILGGGLNKIEKGETKTNKVLMKEAEQAEQQQLAEQNAATESSGNGSVVNSIIPMGETSDKKSILDQLTVNAQWQGPGGNTNTVGFNTESQEHRSDNKILIYLAAAVAAIFVLKSR